MPLSPLQVHALAWRGWRFRQAAGTPDLARLAGVIAAIIAARDGAGFESARGTARPRLDLMQSGPDAQAVFV
jgi:hypothetical protein